MPDKVNMLFDDDSSDNEYHHTENNVKYKTDSNDLGDLVNKQKQKIAELEKKVADRAKYEEQIKLLKEEMEQKNSKRALAVSLSQANERIKKKRGSGARKVIETQSDNQDRIQISMPTATQSHLHQVVDDNWEIVPDSNKPTIEFQNPESDDAFIKRILNVRKRFNEVPEMLLEWSCGSMEWHIMDNVWTDVPDMMKDYTEKHALQCVKDYVLHLEAKDKEEEEKKKQKKHGKKK